MGISHWALMVSALALAGCGGGGKRAQANREAGGTAGHADSGAMGMGQMDSGGMGMGHMDSGDMGMQGMQMMANIRAHMDSMMRMSPDRMSQMMAMHQQMMSQMMDRMGGDMRRMGRPGTPEWDTLSDSVKQDLAELPSLSGQALSTRMRAHADRVRRLLGMHEGMMKSMPK